MNTLYRVNSTILDFHYSGGIYHKMQINWFVKARKNPIMHYEDGILRYSQKKDTALEEKSLNEHFEYSEALAFSSYLFEARNLKSQIIEAELPICVCSLTLYDTDELDPGKDLIKLSESKDYKLSFAVWGCFNLAGTTWRGPDEDSESLKQLDELEDLCVEVQSRRTSGLFK